MKPHKKPGRIETGIYITLFATAFFWACNEISYLGGKQVEAHHHKQERSAKLMQAKHEADYWRGKYNSLADQSDGLTIIAAEAKYQEARK